MLKKRIVSAALVVTLITVLVTFVTPPALAVENNRITVSAGRNHVLAIKSDGSLWAWGSNEYGRLGNGKATKEVYDADAGDWVVTENNDSYTPIKVMDDVISVSAGGLHSMAIKGDGSLWAWGRNLYGILGNGKATKEVYDADAGGWITTENNDSYTPIKIMDDVAYVSAGYNFTLAIKTDGSLWAWGSNFYGQLGNGQSGSTVYSSIPEKILDNVTVAYAGGDFAMAIKTDGSLWSWGSNFDRQLGVGSPDDPLLPGKVMDGVRDIAIGWNDSLVVKTDNTLWRFKTETVRSEPQNNGNSAYNGGSNSGDIITVVQEKLIDDVATAAIDQPGDTYSAYAVLRTNGSLYTWRYNWQHVESTISGWDDLLKVMDDVLIVTTGCFNMYAVKADGSLWAWGDNKTGMIGDGSRTILDKDMNIIEDNDRPSPIKIMDDVMRPSTGLTLAVTSIADETNPAITIGNKLSWNSMPGVDKYDIFRAAPGGSYIKIAADITGNTYVDLAIEPDTEYSYIICPGGKSVDDAAASNAIAVKTGPEAAPLLPDADGNMGKANAYILMQINNPMMDVNGQTVEVDPGRGTAPMIYKDRTVLPIRAVVEAMGGEVGWDSGEKKSTLEANGNTVVMWIGNIEYTVNGVTNEMDIAPFIENDRTFLPLRFATANLNCRVTWLNDTKEILIVYNSGEE